MTGAYFHDRKHGIAPGVLLGMLFRLMGSGCRHFPECRRTIHFFRRGLRRDLPRSACARQAPSRHPHTGRRHAVDNFPDMAEQFGEDSIYPTGFALISHSRKSTGRDAGVSAENRAVLPDEEHPA